MPHALLKGEFTFESDYSNTSLGLGDYLRRQKYRESFVAYPSLQDKK